MNPGRLLVGSVLAAVGAVFLMDSAGVAEAGDLLGTWWPTSIVLLGLFQVVGSRRRGTGLVIIAAGAGLLGVTTGVLGEDAWRFVWPAALVLLGLWVLFGWGRRYGIRPSDDDVVEGISLLGSARLATRSQTFRQATLTAVLGGLTLDLTEALPVPGGAEVSVTALLGSITILVPRGWLVEIRGLPLLGGWDDTTDRTAVGSGAPRLEVHALAALGGLEVKHSARWR